MIAPFPANQNTGRAFRLAALALFGLLGGGCATSAQPKLLTEFYLSSPAGTGVELTLPNSQLVQHRQADPFLNEANVLHVLAGTIDMNASPNSAAITVPCIWVYFDREGLRQIQMHTIAENFGKKIYMFAAEANKPPVPVAVHPITQTIADGPLMMFLEVPGAQDDPKKFSAYVADLEESAQRVQAIKRKQ